MDWEVIFKYVKKGPVVAGVRLAPRHITVTWSASRPTRQKPTRHLVTLPATPTRTDRLRRESRERRETMTGGGARLLWIAATAASSCEPMTCGGARLLWDSRLLLQRPVASCSGHRHDQFKADAQKTTTGGHYRAMLLPLGGPSRPNSVNISQIAISC